MKKFYTLVIFLISLFYSSFYYGNYMLIQNVAMTGENTAAKTVQVQFDISWENSWLDEVNFDAAWVFVKYKDTNGDWHHATINTDGYSNGSGTLNQIDVTEDKVGAFFRTRYYGGGNFDADNVQLQWAYGSDGLSDINGIEIRVFAIEMVYVPEGDFNCSPYITRNNSEKTFLAPGANAPVINSRLSPVLTYNGDSLRIKGNAGIDTDNDGVVDNTTFPTGYFPFYCFKYELTEQQYADFLNTLSPSQIANLGIAGTNISLINDAYVSTTPNKVCSGVNAKRFFAYADWCGLRPMTYLEHNKACYGPEYLYNNNNNQYNNPWNSSSSSIGYPTNQENGEETTNNIYINYSNYLLRAGIFAAGVNASHGNNARRYSGGSYYGIMDMNGSRHSLMWWPLGTFSNVNGNGVLSSSGYTDEDSWSNTNANFNGSQTFRYVRSAPVITNDICYAPQNLNSVITETGVQVSWEPGGSESEWIIEYDTSGFALGSGTQINVSTNSYEIPLSDTATENYDIYVRSVCDNYYSSFTGPTTIAYDDCGEFTFTMIDSYGDGWNGATVSVLVNGNIVLDGVSAPDEGGYGASYYDELFTVNSGDQITLQWTSGSWDGEISWEIKTTAGNLYTSGVWGDTPTIEVSCQ